MEDADTRPAKLFNRLFVMTFGVVAFAEEGAHGGLDAPGPFSGAHARPLDKALERILRCLWVAAPRGRLDQFGQYKATESEDLEVIRAFGGGRRVLVFAEAVVKNRGRPLRDLEPKALAARPLQFDCCV